MKSMKITKYFEIVNPTYAILQVIPHSSCRNYNTSSIAKVISSMKRYIGRKEKKYVIESQLKCTYMIDIYKDDVRFYFVVPVQYKLMLKEKIQDTWNKATVKEVDQVESFSVNSVFYQLEYKLNNAMSLSVDKKSNALLNSLLNVVDIMEFGDRVTVMYNFTPCSQYGWNSSAKRIHEEYKNNIPIPHTSNAKRFIFNSIISALEFIGNVVDGLFGNKIDNPFKELSEIFKENVKKLSAETLRKASDIVINSQIAIISSSDDSTRANNNALVSCNSFYSVNGDNELEYSKVRTLEHIAINKIGVDESSSLIQLPGRDLLERHKIKHVNIQETIVPQELQKGYIKIGKSTYKGNTVQTYFSNDREIANLPVILLGPMGAGKTFQNLQYAKDVIAAGEGLIVIDYIKNCDLANKIEAITPKERLIVLDMSQESSLQAFVYNEYKVQGNTPFERIESANLHQQQVTSLIDAVYIGEPLSGQMRKFFTSAADIVLIHDKMSLRDVIKVLENHEIRNKFIAKVPVEYLPYLSDQIETLRQLDDVDKAGNVVGTKYSKIEHIMDRINALREDVRMRLMFNRSADTNIDFAKAMDNSKVILIKMRADKFRSQHVRNVLTTFFISKIWLACNIRGAYQEKPLRYHLLLDEIFQAPTTYKALDNILRECRKFQLRLVFTAHQLIDLKELNEGLKSAGASYVLMQKTAKENFKCLEHEFKQHGFTVDDLLNLKRYHSLNLISYSGGYSAYEADLYNS